MLSSAKIGRSRKYVGKLLWRQFEVSGGSFVWRQLSLKVEVSVVLCKVGSCLRVENGEFIEGMLFVFKTFVCITFFLIDE